MENNSSGIIEKIRKLIALEESARKMGSLQEAEHVSRKIQKLLAQYNLDLHKDIQSGKTTNKPGVIEKTWLIEELTNRHEGQWITMLYNGLALTNFCFCILKGKKSIIAVIGKEHNVDAVHFFATQLITRIRYMAKDAWKAYDGLEKEKAFKRGFLQGAVNGIVNKLMTEQNKDEEAARNTPNDANSSTMLAIIANNKQEITQYVNNHYGNLRSTGSKKLSAQDGKRLGYKAGNSMSINKGLTGNPTGSKMLN